MAEEISFANGRISNFQGLVTLTLYRVILHTVVHHSSTSTYKPNFFEIEETFCGRTDGRTDGRIHGRTFEAGFIRSTPSKSRPKNYTRGWLPIGWGHRCSFDSPPSNSSKYVSSVCNTAVLIPTSPIASVTPPCCFQRSVRILGVTNERVLYRSTISAEGNDVSRVRSNTDRKGLCDQTVRVSVTMCASISRRSLARRESYNVLAMKVRSSRSARIESGTCLSVGVCVHARSTRRVQ